MIEILASGVLATVQDLGRPGFAALGVSRSGAADRGALELANRLVGNKPSAAGLEVTFGGLRFRTRRTTVVAVTGATCSITTTGEAGRVGFGVAFHLGPGAELALARPPTGLRTYLAVRGGISVDPVLGSRSTDTLAGLGPAPLVPGTHLPIGPVGGLAEPASEQAPIATSPHHLVLAALPGPRDDWVVLGELFERIWTVEPASNRIGVRLAGLPLTRRPGELRPEGMVRGAIQVPPSGQPVLLLADHPVTGGYPVVAVVSDTEIDLAAQLRPGSTLRFRPAKE